MGRISERAMRGAVPATIAAAVALAWSAAAWAQPVPLRVIHGSAVFTGAGSDLTVTTTNGAGTNHSAIDWRSFSVPAGSVTRFVQPSATSTSINRVVEANPSQILGTLSSNGRIVLVNPWGITVGAGAQVDTAGFTASVLAMSEADAIAGRLRFGGGGFGSVQVDGSIRTQGGDVVLIAPNVQVGKPALVESDGAVILAAGQTVEITGRGLEGILMEVQAGTEAVNLGSLTGDAVGMFAGTLTHSSWIAVRPESDSTGKVFLKAAEDIRLDGVVDGRAAEIRLEAGRDVLLGKGTRSGPRVTAANVLVRAGRNVEIATDSPGFVDVWEMLGYLNVTITAGNDVLMPAGRLLGADLDITADRGSVELGDRVIIEAWNQPGRVQVSAGREIRGRARFDVGSLSMIASDGSISFGKVRGRSGEGGTSGATIDLHASGDISGGTIEAAGADVTSLSSSPRDVRDAGFGGNVSLVSDHGRIDVAGIDVHGGTSSVGGNGGDGGSVVLKAGSGDLVAGAPLQIDARGGLHAAGGWIVLMPDFLPAQYDGSGAGHGGAGGSVRLEATQGSVVLQGVQVHLAGAVPGTFSARGATVEVQQDFALDGLWSNASVVNVRGSSVLSGPGAFDNRGELVLFDAARVVPEGSVSNPAGGRLRAQGGATQANLSSNAGRLEVAAGARLTVPGPLANTGSMTVDGALVVGGTELANAAGAVLAGSGTVTVNDGAGIVDNHGTIAPGGDGSVGTLTLDAQLAMQAGSTLASDLQSATASDRIVVSGDAALDANSSVVLHYLPQASFAPGQVVAIARAGSLSATPLPQVVDDPAHRPMLIAGWTAAATGTQLLLTATTPPEAQALVQQTSAQLVAFPQRFEIATVTQDDERRRAIQVAPSDILLTGSVCKPVLLAGSRGR